MTGEQVVNVFGIEMHIKSEAELRDAPEGTILIMMRVVDVMGDEAYIPDWLRQRRRRTPCEGCREICWYDPHTLPHRARLLCTHCSTDELKRKHGGQ